MKYYLINESECWADEFDWPFFDVLNEEEYQKYMYIKQVKQEFYYDYYFGTNEGWSGDLDLLHFKLIEISPEEADVLLKYKPKCDSVYSQLMEAIDDYAYNQFGYCISDLSLEGFKKEFNKIKW